MGRTAPALGSTSQPGRPISNIDEHQEDGRGGNGTAAGARAGRGIWHALAPRRAAARTPRSCPARSLPDRRSGRRSSASGRPGRWPGSSLRSPLPPHRSALAHISMPAMEYVPRAACGASRAFCVRTLKLYHGCVLFEHVCPPRPDTYLYRHHTWSRRVLCEIIR